MGESKGPNGHLLRGQLGAGQITLAFQGYQDCWMIHQPFDADEIPSWSIHNKNPRTGDGSFLRISFHG